MKALVVDDDAVLADLVAFTLRRQGFEVIQAHDGLAALQRWQEDKPDLIILDLNLPATVPPSDGFTILQRIREKSDTPVILLTVRGEEDDIVSGLKLGADDYVVKPFSPQELVSRVRAVLRRVRPAGEVSGERPYTSTDLRVDPQTRLATVRGQEISLTVKEFDLLWLLARHPRQVFTREQLLESIWGISEYIDPGTVTVHIRRLREKIEADPSAPQHILTVWGVGYKFEP